MGHPPNNHITGLSYDSSGNTQTDGSYTYTWDGESQLKTAAGVTYNYDGDGRRASKAGSKLYWYGSGGEILAETDAAGNTQNEYIFFGGKRVAMVPATGSALYYAEDTLGSSRVIVQSNGTLCYDADFTPFGGERSITSTCAQNYKFEGKERDTETQNDDFGARYYSWRVGRWLSSDWSAVPVPVPYANLTNPQTLNLYAMVADDPESFADLDGHLLDAAPDGGLTPGGQPDNCANDQQKCAAEQPPPPQQQAQNQSSDQPSGQNPPEQKPPSSWKPGQPLPNDPSGLGPDWHQNPDHKNPNGEQWVNDKTGEKVEFERGRPGETGNKEHDHWHYTPPGGDRGKDHIRPGDVGKLLVTAGQGVVQTIRDHPVATGVVVGTVAIGATILTGGAAAPALALIP